MQNLITRLKIKSEDNILVINDKINLLQVLYQYSIRTFDKYLQITHPDSVIIFLQNISDIDTYMSEYINNLYNHTHILRICYPKQASGIYTDTARNQISKYMIEKYSLTWVRVISLNEEYSAFEFTKINQNFTKIKSPNNVYSSSLT